MASRITVSDHLDESSHKDLDLLSLDSLSSLGTTTPGFSSHDGQVPLQVKLVTTLEQLTATLHSARIEDPQNECVKRQEQILLGVLKDVVDLGGGEEKTRRESQESVTQTKKEDEKKLREEYHLQLNKAESERIFAELDGLKESLKQRDEFIKVIQHDHEETIRRLMQSHEETIRHMSHEREETNRRLVADISSMVQQERASSS